MYKVGSAPASGALLERPVFSLGSRGTNMKAFLNKNKTETEKKNGSDSPRTAEDTPEEISKAWDDHEQLIAKMEKYIEVNRHINNEAKQIVKDIGTSAKRLRQQLRGPKGSLEPSGKILATRLRKYSETSAAMDSEYDDGSTTDGRQIRKALRRKRSSPGDHTKALKKKKAKDDAPSQKGADEPPKGLEWKLVRSRKTRKKVDSESLDKQPRKHEKKREKKKQHKASIKPSALIIRPRDKKEYADILKQVKEQVPCDRARECVERVRRTATGDMLIVLAKDTEDKAKELHLAITELLGDKADVLSKGPEEDLEIKDLDELVTKEEVHEALQLAVGADLKIPLDVVRSLRKAYGGTLTAAVTVPAAMAKAIIGESGKIRIGWVNCRIRKVERLVKCYKCWHYGHLAMRCKGTVDRTNLCMKCGQAGHKIADCEKEAHCTLCAERDPEKSSAHAAGSSKCPVLREALQKVHKQ